MSQWTDEQLSDLLREAFVEREAKADPDVARRIAAQAPSSAARRGWPILAAAAAVVLLVAGIQALRPDDPSVRPPQLGPPRAEVTPTPPGHNRRVAVATASRILAGAPVPPGAVSQLAVSPRSLHRLGAYYDDVDPSLTQTGYWIVPMSHVDLVDWYAEHTPANREETTISGSETPVPEGVMSWRVGQPTTAYTQPALVVAYARLRPDRTALRIDVTLASRYDRTAETLVPSTALDSATITAHTVDGRPPSPPVQVTDPAELRALADRFDHASLAPVHSALHPCGSPTGDYRLYSVDFHWPGHVLEVTTGQPLCGIGRDLILDGSRQRPKLGPDAPFDDLLAALAKNG